MDGGAWMVLFPLLFIDLIILLHYLFLLADAKKYGMVNTNKKYYFSFFINTLFGLPILCFWFYCLMLFFF